MIGSGFAGVVGKAPLLRHHCIGAGREHYIARQPLLPEYPVGFVGYDIRTRNIDGECLIPEPVFDVTRFVGGNKDSRRHNNSVNPAISQKHIVEHLLDACAAGDIAGEADSRSAVADPCASDSDALAIF